MTPPGTISKTLGFSYTKSSPVDMEAFGSTLIFFRQDTFFYFVSNFKSFLVEML